MPEGPSIVILTEEIGSFAGKKVLKAEGNAKIDMHRMENMKLLAIKSWGKQTLLCFKGFYVRIHLLMFGTYRVNERKETAPRLRLTFARGEFSFYTCSVKMVDGDVEKDYDRTADIMSAKWSGAKAEKKLKGPTGQTKSTKKTAKTNVCDALLNQDVFSGVGNIIKNEVLFRMKIHPESTIQGLPAKKLKAMIKDAAVYSHRFYAWKKAFVLKKHWQIYKQKECPRCHIKAKVKYIGKTKRRTHYCDNCQVKYVG